MVIKRSQKRKRKEQAVQNNEEETQPSPSPSQSLSGVDEIIETLIEKLGKATKKKGPVVVLAHGAGAPSSSDWIIRWKGMLAESLNAIEVVTFDYPYITGKKRWVPPKAEKLVDHHLDIVRKTMDKFPGHPLVLAGKSMGSRVSCMVAGNKDIAVSAVVCLGYPLKGSKGALQDETLLPLTVPVMFVQGSKDGLCSLVQLEDVRKKMNAPSALHVIEGGDHSFKIAKTDLVSPGSCQEEAEKLAVRAISEFVSSFLEERHVATPPTSPSPSSSHSTSPLPTTLIRKKRTRRATQCVGWKKLPLDFDDVTEKTKRTHQVKLSSFLGKLAREHVSILYSKWSHVPDDDKEKMWQEVLANFDISNTEQMKKKVLQSLGIKWRHFKTQLTRFWIYGSNKNLSPCEQYNIPQDEWDEFKKSRLDPAWEETRKNAQETQKWNTTPHTLSRGGYSLLDEKIMADKLKKRLEKAAESDTDVEPPSPPKRHERFKLARIKTNGEMTSDAAREIAKRIDELEEQAAEGSFVPEGREDILTTAIGRPEHPGRVRGAGFGVGLRDYFGPQPRGSPISGEFLGRLTQKITREVTQNLVKQFGPALISMGAQSQQTPVKELGAQSQQTPVKELGAQSQQTPVKELGAQSRQTRVKEHTPHVAPVSRVGSCAPIELGAQSRRTRVKEHTSHVAPVSRNGSCVAPIELGAQPLQTRVKEHTSHVAHISRNGSCVAPINDPQGEETHNGVSDRCELYIDEQPPRMVAFGRVHKGGSNLHGVPLSDDLVRVSVEDVRDGLARVPRSTAEVSLVGQALGGFIAWPRHLIKPISAEDIKRPKKRVRPVDRSSQPPVDRSSQPPVDKSAQPSVDKSSQPSVDRSSQPSVNNLILELLNIAPSLYNKPLRVAWDASAFGVENDTPLYIHHNEVLEVFQGRVGLSMPVVQFWVMFLNSLSMGMGNEDLYGFFEPQSIQSLGGRRKEATEYMQKHVQNSKKPIYLGAYHQEENWQLLVLLPKEGIAVWLCSQHRKPDTIINVIVQGLVSQLNKMDKQRKKSKETIVRWIYPKSNKQDGGWESGYYVMHWMWTIVQARIKDSWSEVFCDDKALPSASIEKIRTQWARYFFEKRLLVGN